MYSLEEKQLAVDTYNKLRSLRKTIRILGYPARRTLELWIRKYNSAGCVKAKYSVIKPRYSEEDILSAIDYYLSHGQNITKTCKDLGYPCRTVLSKWLDEKNIHKCKQDLKGSHLLKYSFNDRITAAVELTCRSTSVKAVSEKTGVSPVSLYAWKKQLIPESETVAVEKTIIYPN